MIMDTLFSDKEWLLTNSMIETYFAKIGYTVLGEYKAKQVSRVYKHVKVRKVVSGKSKFLGIPYITSYSIIEEDIPFSQSSIKRTIGYGKWEYCEKRDYDIEYIIDEEDKTIYWKVIDIGDVYLD